MVYSIIIMIIVVIAYYRITYYIENISHKLQQERKELQTIKYVMTMLTDRISGQVSKRKAKTVIKQL